MKQSIFVAVVMVILGYQLTSAQQTQNPWLIGRWDGSIEGFTSQGEPARMLRVHSISVQGGMVGFFGIPPEGRGKVEVKVDGSQVRFFVPRIKSTVELTKEGDEVLVGKMIFASGRELPLKLTKTKLSNQFDGKYSGTSTVGRGCGTGYYEIAVKDSLITGWFQFHFTFGGVTNQSSTVGEITGEASGNGTALIELRGPRNSQFSGTFTGSELKAIDPPIGNRGCSYELTLKRS